MVDRLTRFADQIELEDGAYVFLVAYKPVSAGVQT
jgi:hypothetical protein